MNFSILVVAVKGHLTFVSNILIVLKILIIYNLSSNHKSMKLSEKKKSVAGKMKEPTMGLRHFRESHGYPYDKKKKGRDNEVMEGKGEKELN